MLDKLKAIGTLVILAILLGFLGVSQCNNRRISSKLSSASDSLRTMSDSLVKSQVAWDSTRTKYEIKLAVSNERFASCKKQLDIVVEKYRKLANSTPNDSPSAKADTVWLVSYELPETLATTPVPEKPKCNCWWCRFKRIF